MTTTISTLRRFLAVPLVLAATVSLASASEIRDGAKMFSADAIRKAEAVLDRAAVPVVIETVTSLGGQSADDAVTSRARGLKDARVYVLISKNDNKFRYAERDTRFTEAQGRAVRDAFLNEFRRKDFDSGLIAGSEAISSAVSTWPNRAVAGGRNVRVAPRGVPVRNGSGSPFTFILIIGGIVLAVLFGMRILGSLFGAGRGGYGAQGGMRPGMGGQGMGGQGMSGPGMGYGGGGGGGGFFSSLLGGIGGAMAGNWMYDQFRGRGHSGYEGSDAGSYGTESAPPAEDAGWGGVGGGDWGGGDAGGGGGGDWGGGGGDGGGGGGDW